MHQQFILPSLILAALTGSNPVPAAEPPTTQPVRVAVVQGLTRTGLWSEIIKRFEKESGRKVEVTTGQRPDVAKALREGRVDCAVMHTGDVATALVTEGFGTTMQAWARNEYVMIGPGSDPAMIKGLNDGAEALKRVGGTQSTFVNHEGAGSRELVQALVAKAAVTPDPKWFLEDESGDEGIVAFAAAKKAYVIVSRNPKVIEESKKVKFEIMVESDPLMKRAFVFIEANPVKFPTANRNGAQALSRFLLSEKLQTALSELSKLEPADRSFLYPAGNPDPKRR
jgi:tungstate transport system substrate-binding protein